MGAINGRPFSWSFLTRSRPALGKTTPSSQSDYRENVYGQCRLVEEPLELGLPAPNWSELPQFSRLVRIPSEMSLIETLKNA